MTKIIIRKTLCGCRSEPFIVESDIFSLEVVGRIFKFNGEFLNDAEVFEEVEMKRSKLENFDVEKDVTVSKDGDLFCALLGSDSWSGRVGFGKTEIEALEDLQPKLTMREWSNAKVFKVAEND